MTPKEIRAYRFGYLRAMRRARRELQQMAQHWDDELCRVDDEMRVAREQIAQHVDAEIAGLMGEMKGMRDEYRRLRAIEHAIDTERDIDTWLN
jgi:hypothetical protein